MRFKWWMPSAPFIIPAAGRKGDGVGSTGGRRGKLNVSCRPLGRMVYREAEGLWQATEEGKAAGLSPELVEEPDRRKR